MGIHGQQFCGNRRAPQPLLVEPNAISVDVKLTAEAGRYELQGCWGLFVQWK